MNNFWHKWMNPHCPDCIQERENQNRCKTCEVLVVEIDRLTRAYEYLLQQSRPKTEVQDVKGPPENWAPVRNNIPWRVRQQMLEEEDRNKARVMREQAIFVDKPQITQDDLDKELEQFK